MSVGEKPDVAGEVFGARNIAEEKPDLTPCIRRGGERSAQRTHLPSRLSCCLIRSLLCLRLNPQPALQTLIFCSYDEPNSFYLYSELNVILGAHNIKKKENNTQVIPVLKAVSHHHYNNKTYVNDIMLLKVPFF